MRRIALFALPALACSGTDSVGAQAVSLQFALRSGDTAVTCDTPLKGDARMRDARFYVANVALLDPSGAELPVTLTPDGLYQSEDLALVDLEAACETSGTPALHAVLTGTAPEGAIAGVAFDLGVPFELNHLDGTTAPAPLDNTAMFWGWQAGYKFLRLDLALPQSGYNVHLGSTGCTSDSAVKPPASCARPNRVRVTLTGFDPARHAVALDIDALLAGIDLTANTEGTPLGCQSDAAEPADCTPVLAHLGLDYASGQPAGTQTAFRLVDR